MNRQLIGWSLAMAALGFAAPASAQYAAPPQARYQTYRPAAPRYYQRVAPAPRYQRPQSSLPYNRSPYTDDWSTSRHLPFPKPWMLPTRDPAHRGR